MWDHVVQLLFIAPLLSVNNLLVALTLGLSRTYHNQALKIGLIFGTFDLSISLLGLWVGHSIFLSFAGPVQYLGSFFLIGTGVWFGWRGLKKMRLDSALPLDPNQTGRGLSRFRDLNWGIMLIAVGVSLDNLLVGTGLGVRGFSIYLASVVFGLSTFILTMLSVMLGRTIRERIILKKYLSRHSVKIRYDFF